LFDGVHLPDLVGLTAPLAFQGSGSAGPRRGNALTAEPTLEGPRARPSLRAAQVRQLDAQASGSPAGMLGVQLQERGEQRRRARTVVLSAGLVVGNQSVVAVHAEPVQQDANGTAGQLQARGNGRGGESLSGQAEDGLANSGTVRTRHGTPAPSECEGVGIVHR
jgi:hypothetical protein